MRRLKYDAVVSLRRSGGFHAPIFPTAAATPSTALFWFGTEPWPAGPVTMSSTGRGSFSVVPTLACTHLAAAPHDAAALGQAELGVDGVEVAVGHELRADVRRAFLAGFGQQDHVAIERRLGAMQLQDEHQAGDQVVLVVDRAAAVDVAAVDGRRRTAGRSTSSGRR